LHKRLGIAVLTAAVLLFAYPLTSHAATAKITGVVESGVVHVNDLVRFNGIGLANVEQVLVDDQRASFFVNGDQRITVRIPIGVDPGDVNITLITDVGEFAQHGLIEVVAKELPSDSKITIGTFQGYVAVYTKGLSGSKLSIRVGSRWRQIEALQSDFSKNLTRVGANKIVPVQVYVDGVLVKVEQLISG
jgi:hypothetical protein